MKKYVTRGKCVCFPAGSSRLDLAPLSFYCVVVLNMAASRLFSQVSDDDLVRFSEEHLKYQLNVCSRFCN